MRELISGAILHLFQKGWIGVVELNSASILALDLPSDELRRTKRKTAIQSAVPSNQSQETNKNTSSRETHKDCREREKRRARCVGKG